MFPVNSFPIEGNMATSEGSYSVLSWHDRTQFSSEYHLNELLCINLNSICVAHSIFTRAAMLHLQPQMDSCFYPRKNAVCTFVRCQISSDTINLSWEICELFSLGFQDKFFRICSIMYPKISETAKNFSLKYKCLKGKFRNN